MAGKEGPPGDVPPGEVPPIFDPLTGAKLPLKRRRTPDEIAAASIMFPIEESLSQEELEALGPVEITPGSPLAKMRANMEAAKTPPGPTEMLDAEQDKIDQMLEASGQQPTLLGS